MNDRILPQDLEAEKSVLASMMIEPECITEVLDRLNIKSFSSPANRIIFKCITHIHSSEELEVDLLTVASELTRVQRLELIGGSIYLVEVQNSIATTAHLESWCNMVASKHALRELNIKLLDFAERCYTEDKPDILCDEVSLDVTNIQEHVLKATQGTSRNIITPFDVKDRVRGLLDEKALKGLSTGFDGALDEIYTLSTNGITVITGVPGHGKSSFVDNLIANTIKLHDWKWGIFSPEKMPAEKHVRDLIQIMSDKSFADMSKKDRKVVDEVVNKSVDAINPYVKFIIKPEEGYSIEVILRKIKALHKKYGLNAYLLDPYNEFSDNRDMRVDEMSYISQFLGKIRGFNIAHNLHAFVVAHPVKMKKIDGTNTPIVPRGYDISGSAHWNNKADEILSVWRDKASPDPKTRNTLLVLADKIREKEFGSIGERTLHYHYKTGILTKHPKYPSSDRPPENP